MEPQTRGRHGPDCDNLSSEGKKLNFLPSMGPIVGKNYSMGGGWWVVGGCTTFYLSTLNVAPVL